MITRTWNKYICQRTLYLYFSEVRDRAGGGVWGRQTELWSQNFSILPELAIMEKSVFWCNLMKSMSCLLPPQTLKDRVHWNGKKEENNSSHMSLSLSLFFLWGYQELSSSGSQNFSFSHMTEGSVGTQITSIYISRVCVMCICVSAVGGSSNTTLPK